MRDIDESVEDVESSRFDWWLLGALVFLLCLGLININSATAVEGSAAFFRQLTWIGVSFAMMGSLLFFDYRLIERVGYVIYGLNLLLLLAVPVIGVTRYGAKRWLNLGFMTFQPSETMKIATIIALAKYFHSVGAQKTRMGLKELLIPGLILGVPALLTIAQPDLGTGGHILITGSIILLFVGIKRRILVTAAVAATLLLGFVGLIATGVLPPSAAKYVGLKEYQLTRIMTFASPEGDAQGKNYNITQSLLAIGSGGWFGKGYRQGSQTQYDFTPEEHTDFIFTVLAEEWGLLGGIALLIGYLVLFQRMIHVSSLARDRFGALLGVGILGMLASQVAINLAMVMGLFPVVGIPLPYLSYGGTSLMNTIFAASLVLNVSFKRTMF